ncbi:MAG TPA: copper chaperone PCu(A)C, partial [Xanthomonadales bacterium]|nr:copper chaperone PCu(A)C [Xanthomonadales bacterium]
GLNRMKSFFSLSLIVTLTTVFLLSCTGNEQHGGLEWNNGWVRALPPGSGMTSAYGEIRNGSNESLELTAYDSSAFAHVSLHQSSLEKGVSRMQEQGVVVLEPGESMHLQPGGLHLMLMKVTAAVEAGQEIEIGVSTADQRFEFSLPVEAR